jgi:hypothetical protein
MGEGGNSKGREKGVGKEEEGAGGAGRGLEGIKGRD